MDRRKTDEVLFYALQCAKSDRMGFASAVENDPKEHANALADIKAFERLQIIFFGTNKSELDSETDKMVSKSVYRLKEILKETPELFNHSSECQCEYCKLGAA